MLVQCKQDQTTHQISNQLWYSGRQDDYDREKNERDTQHEALDNF
jgi:hypothetical protein